MTVVEGILLAVSVVVFFYLGVAMFVFGIGIVRVLGRMIDRDTDPAGFEDEQRRHRHSTGHPASSRSAR